MSIGLVIRSLAALLFGSSSQRLAELDFERELDRNEQLRRSGKGAQDAVRDEIKAITRDRIALLRRRLLSSLALMGSAVIVAKLTTSIGIGVPTPQPILTVASVFCFAWATLGRLGWSGQSYKGDSSIERLDLVLFHALYWLGMYLATVVVI